MRRQSAPCYEIRAEKSVKNLEGRVDVRLCFSTHFPATWIFTLFTARWNSSRTFSVKL